MRKTDNIDGREKKNYSKIMFWDFKPPLSIISKTTRQKVNNELEDFEKYYKLTKANKHV